MKKLLLIIIAFVISPIAFSQTAYEKKCAQIFTKYWNLFYGKPMSQYEKMQMQSIATYDIAKGFLQVGALNYAMQTGKNLETLLKQVEKEYTSARTLMTKKEKQEYIVEQERKSHYGKIKWDTGLEFVKWMQKGEYEKTDSYNMRLITSIDAYDSLLYKNIIQEIKEEDWDYSIGKYDADAEEMIFKFYDKDKKCVVAHKIKMPVETAKKIHERNINFKMFYNDDEILLDSVDLVFVPRYFYLESKSNYSEPQVLKYDFDNIAYLHKGLSLVKYKYDDLNLGIYGIENKYMKGHVFDYNKHIANIQQKQTIRDSLARREQEIRDSIARREQRIRDSIAKREQEIRDSIDYVLYTKQLDSFVNDINTKLLDYKYNIMGLKVENNEKIEKKNPKVSYQSAVSKLQTQRNEIKKKLQDDHDKIFEQNSDVFGENMDEFDKYYCQGIEYFNANIEFLRVLKYVENNTHRISTINFKKK